MSDPEIESLREELAKLHREIADARVDRATRNLELMRNWMTVYTPIVGMMFLLFAALGYKGMSDIQSNREKVEATAGKAENLLSNVTTRFSTMEKEQEKFEQLVSDNQQVVQQNKTALKDFRLSVDELERKQTTLRNDIEHNSEVVSAKFSSSQSLTSGISDILSSQLNVPLVTSSGPLANNARSIGGFGFGTSRGRVLMKSVANQFSLSLDLTRDSDAEELASDQIVSWTDKEITFRLSGTKTTALQVQVITGSGTKSNVYFVPAPVTGLSATVD